MNSYSYTVQSGETVDCTVGFSILKDRLIQQIQQYPVAIVCVDEKVYRAHQKTVDSVLAAHENAVLIQVPSGEASKCRATKASIEDQAIAAGAGRDSIFVAIGGGVVGDLVGYVAATYMRGVALVQVPTTIVSMVDSSIGGKTGIDIEAGKNLIGAFKHPLEIVSDLQWLESLPQKEFRDGLAEVIKHAAIRDADLWNFLEDNTSAIVRREPEVLQELVVRNQKIKIDVVVEDTRESGLRKLLNFGHTVGHSIELLADYQRAHGVCVYQGMLVEALLGEQLEVTESGTCAKILALGRELGFDAETEHIGMDPGVIVDATKTDKKMKSGQVHYVLLESIGRSAFLDSGCSRAIDDKQVLEALTNLPQCLV